MLVPILTNKSGSSLVPRFDSTNLPRGSVSINQNVAASNAYRQLTRDSLSKFSQAIPSTPTSPLAPFKRSTLEQADPNAVPATFSMEAHTRALQRQRVFEQEGVTGFEQALSRFCNHERSKSNNRKKTSNQEYPREAPRTPQGASFAKYRNPLAKNAPGAP